MKNKHTLFLIGLLFVLCLITAACNGEPNKTEAKNPNLTEIRDAVAETYGDTYTATYSGTKEELCSFISLDESKIDDFFFNMPLMSVNADVFIGIKATEGNGDDVETALNNYKNYLTNESMQYPMNLAKVNSTTVTRYGNYVFLVMLGDPGSDIEDEAEAAEYCKMQNKKGTDKIAEFFAD